MREIDLNDNVVKKAFDVFEAMMIDSGHLITDDKSKGTGLSSNRTIPEIFEKSISTFFPQSTSNARDVAFTLFMTRLRGNGYFKDDNNETDNDKI